MRRLHLSPYLFLPFLLLFTLTADVSAQLVDPTGRPQPSHNPHPPSQPIFGPRHETEIPRRIGEGMSVSRSSSKSERKTMAGAALKAADKAYRSDPPLYMYAVDAYRYAAELNPEEERAYIGLGNVYAALTRYDIATRMYERAARIKPKSAEAHYGLGLAYHAQGKKEAALEEYKNLQRLNKKLAAKLGSLLNQGGKQ